MEVEISALFLALFTSYLYTVIIIHQAASELWGSAGELTNALQSAQGIFLIKFLLQLWLFPLEFLSRRDFEHRGHSPEK
jgi:hypothetical protein